MNSLRIIKIGGNIINDDTKLGSFLQAFALLNGQKILIHGGGKLATKLAQQLNIPQQLIEGRRVTDAETLKIVTMVYAGSINKTIIAQLQAAGCNAIGLTGADGNLILAHKRIAQNSLSGDGSDYGFAGDIDEVNTALMKSFLEQNIALVFAPITHDGAGQLLNTNADTVAQELAKAMSPLYEVELIYSFEKAGVLLNAEDETTVIKKIDAAFYKRLKDERKVFAGMIPKLDNAFKALEAGVKKVVIGKAENLGALLTGEAGTSIVL